MTSPSPSPPTSADARAQRPRTVRIRTLMVVVAGIAAWLGLLRAAPIAAVAVALLAGPTLRFQRRLLREIERGDRRTPSPADFVITLAVSAMFSALVVGTALAVLLALAALLRQMGAFRF